MAEGGLTNRDALLERFRGTTALRDAWQWYFDARKLLELLEARLASDESHQHGSKRVLWMLILRMRRYFLALSGLTFQTDENAYVHAIDGYHAVHKSLFETYIEFSVCTVYLEQFPSGDPGDMNLLERLGLHAQTNALKKNSQRLYRLPAWQAFLQRVSESGHDIQVPDSINNLMNEPLDDVKARLKGLIERLQGPKVGIGQYRHWFPEKDMQDQFFVAVGESNSTRPRNCGSIEWLCKAVLSRHTPDPTLSDWWISAYDNDYELINIYTHPVMGYDDCFRGTAERSLDLAQMQLSMRVAFHQVVLPPLRAYFREVWLELVEEEEQLLRLHLKSSRTVMPFLQHVHQQDRDSLPDGPSLWS